MILFAKRAILLAVLFLAMLAPGVATEYLSINDEFGITRDFSEIIIADANLRNARLFVDPVRNASPSEIIELQQAVIDLLSDKIRLVPNKAEANYWLQVVLQQYTDYATRKPKGVPAHGNVLMAICGNPIEEVTVDCDSLTYYYFRDYRKIDILRRVLAMWMPTVFQSSTK